MATRTFKAAALNHRIVHFFVDTWTYTLIWMALGFIAYKLGGKPNSDLGRIELPIKMVLGTMLVTAYFGYYIISEYFFQKTFGKRITGTVVVDKSGDRPTLGKVILRTLLRLFPLEQFSFLILPFGLHDLWSGTMVIQEKEKTIHNKT